MWCILVVINGYFLQNIPNTKSKNSMHVDTNLKTLESNFSRLKEVYYKQSFDKVSFITYCVEKSTIRSFNSSKGYVKIFKPLSIFRVWAFNFLSEKKNIDTLNASDNFIDFRKSTLKDLEKFWTLTDGATPLILFMTD